MKINLKQVEKIVKEGIPLKKFRARKDFCYVFPNEPLIRKFPYEIYKITKVDLAHLFLVKNRNYYFLFPGKSFEIASNRIFQKFKENPKLFDKIFKKFKNESKKCLRLGKKIESIKLNKNNLKEVLNLFTKTVKDYLETAGLIAPMWLLILEDSPLENYLKNYLSQKISDFPKVDNIFATLIQPPIPTPIYQEKKSLFKILDELPKKLIKKIRKLNLKDLILFFKNEPKIKKLIKNHLEKFEWIPFEYLGPNLIDFETVISNLKEIINRRNWQKEKNRHLNFYKEVKKQQDNLFKKFKINKKYKNYFKSLQHLNVLFDFRKEIFTKMCLTIQRFYKNLAKFYGVKNYRDFLWLTYEEMVNFIKNGELDTKIIKKRKRLVFYIYTSKSWFIVSGNKAQKISKIILSQFKRKKKEIGELKGQVAQKAKNIISGVVRVILSSVDIPKMKEEEILVTPMTNPTFTLAIKKAKAIITDEGGLLCHAAIVSRELKIPCIIGTKIATKVLKDGDLVEVDANKGIIKILK